MSNGSNPTNAEAKVLLERARHDLEHVFDAVNSADEKSNIFRAIRAINNELIALEVAVLRQRDAEYHTLTVDIKKSAGRLKGIKERVDHIVAATETAERIIATLGSVIALLARFAA